MRTSGGSSRRVKLMIGEHSVVPNMIENRTSKRCSHSRASAAGTGAPPEATTRRLDRSRLALSGWPSMAISIVGTPPLTVARSDSISSSCSAGSNRVMQTSVAWVVAAPSTPRPQPAVWNSGIGHTTTSPAPTPICIADSQALLTTPRWCSSTPLGKPVVPEVYWICTWSAGSTSGSAMCGSADATNCAQSSSATTSRSSGTSGRTSATMADIGLPRNSVMWNRPALRDWRSTYANSEAW